MANTRFADLANMKSLFAGLKQKYQPKDASIVSDASYVHTDNNYTTSEKQKLAGITTESTLTDSTNLPTGAAVKSFVEGKGYITSSDVASAVSAGVAAGIAASFETMTWADIEGSNE